MSGFLSAIPTYDKISQCAHNEQIPPFGTYDEISQCAHNEQIPPFGAAAFNPLITNERVIPTVAKRKEESPFCLTTCHLLYFDSIMEKPKRRKNLFLWSYILTPSRVANFLRKNRMIPY